MDARHATIHRFAPFNRKGCSSSRGVIGPSRRREPEIRSMNGILTHKQQTTDYPVLILNRSQSFLQRDKECVYLFIADMEICGLYARMQGISTRVSGYRNGGRSTEYEKATQRTATRRRRPNGVLNQEKSKMLQGFQKT